MNSNSDGLSPGLRPFLGVGHNRALPAAFGFDNCIEMDGINGYAISTKQLGVITQDSLITIEFWIEFKNIDNRTVCSLIFGNGVRWHIYFISNTTFRLEKTMGATASKNNITAYEQAVTGNKVHVVLRVSANGTAININGFSMGVSYQLAGNNFESETTHISNVILGKAAGGSGGWLNHKLDEFRIYDKRLTDAEIMLNYNGGVGENPCVTENLMAWYRFEKFENLDFSALQDNSDIRLGLRDHSGKCAHQQPINMDTNPASGTYVLKPF